MRLIFVLLIAFLAFVVCLLFIAWMNAIPFRRTIDRNIHFVRLFWSIVDLWRRKSFLKNISDLDQYDIDTLNKDDARLEHEYFTKISSSVSSPKLQLSSSSPSFDRSLSKCLSSVQSVVSLAYNDWWRHCVTTRTRTIEK